MWCSVCYVLASLWLGRKVDISYELGRSTLVFKPLESDLKFLRFGQSSHMNSYQFLGE